MVLSNREYVGRALETLAAELEPSIAEVLSRVAPGVEWTKIIQHKDENAGRSAQSYSPTDLSVQLRVMTEALGSLGGVAVDELRRETIRTFGAKRLTAGVSARLNQGLQYGVDTGRLELHGEFVQLAG